MTQLLLFSFPTEHLLHEIISILFSHEIKQKVFAYMPSEGVERGKKYHKLQQVWEEQAKKYEAQFLLIDNASSETAMEQKKLRQANILLITGGNPCILLQNLRHSGLDQIILELSQKEITILAGYSAGAMIYTPSVTLADFDSDSNKEVGLQDFRALHLVDFEIAPHYTPAYETTLKAYRQICSHPVRPLTDNEYIQVELPQYQ